MNKSECTTCPNGTKYWYVKRDTHPEDGPVVEYSHGTKVWYLSGHLHREDGPAVEWTDGAKWWHLNNKEVRPEEIVDLWLERGVFCYYDEETHELNFDS